MTTQPTLPLRRAKSSRELVVERGHDGQIYMREVMFGLTLCTVSMTREEAVEVAETLMAAIEKRTL